VHQPRASGSSAGAAHVGQPRQPDLAAQALSGQAAAESWVATQGLAVALGLAAMRTAKAIFDHAATVRALTAEYATLSEQFRATFTTSRPLFDSGAAALKLLELGIDGSSRRPVAVRRAATTARADDDEKYTVQWRACTVGEPFDAITTSLPLFRTMVSLLDSLYHRQLEARRTLDWGGHSIKFADGHFRIEQLARATADGVVEVLGGEAMQPRAFPVVAVAAAIDEPAANASLDHLREELQRRVDEWRKKPGLLRRRYPLRGRMIYME
jgi:hypothetical protein